MQGEEKGNCAIQGDSHFKKGMASATAAAPKRNEITVLETPPPGKSGADDIDEDGYMPAVFSWLSVEVPVFLFAFREDFGPEIFTELPKKAVPGFAYHFCLNLSAAFLLLGTAL